MLLPLFSLGNELNPDATDVARTWFTQRNGESKIIHSHLTMFKLHKQHPTGYMYVELARFPCPHPHPCWKTSTQYVDKVTWPCPSPCWRMSWRYAEAPSMWLRTAHERGWVNGRKRKRKCDFAPALEWGWVDVRNRKRQCDFAPASERGWVNVQKRKRYNPNPNTKLEKYKS